MGKPETKLRQVQPPQQVRSLKTMNQILDAAKVLLEEKNFDELTIAEIVQHAKCSVGAFYGRFPDKDALLHALDERYFQEFVADSEAILNEASLENKSISEITHIIIAFMVDVYGKQKGLLRTLSLRARLRSDMRFLERERQAWKLFPKLRELLLAHVDDITHPNPQQAIEFGLLQAFYTLREMLLWEHLESGYTFSKDELISELTRSYLAYLGVT